MNKHVKNILEVYNRATPEDIASGLEWYDRAKRYAKAISTKYFIHTHTVIGVFEKNALSHNWRMMSHVIRTEDERWIVLEAFLRKATIAIRDVEGVCISSVVPDQNIHYVRMIRKYLSIEPLLIDHNLNLNLEIAISEPALLGADRICNAVAAKEKYGLPVIVVDLGTATTFDIVNEMGAYIGGIIIPGPETSMAELAKKAARLFEIRIEPPKTVIGKSTKHALQSGLFYGTVGQVDFIIDQIIEESGFKNCTVVATGGFAKGIEGHSKHINLIEPTLTLEGLKLIHEMN